MDILYVCNVKMRKSIMLEAIFNRICIIDYVNRHVKNIALYIEKINRLNDNIFLLLNKIRRVIVFK